MKTFTEITKEVGHTDKESTHGYGWCYDYWFKDLRDKPLNILEVGVCVFGGGCVLSLAEYFPNATIYAADIDNTRCVNKVFEHPRIKFLHGDAYNKNDFLPKLGDVKFDIILDDASHEVADQFKLLESLVSYLKDDGFYIVEDVCTIHWVNENDNILKKARKLGLKQTIIDMSTDKHYDSTLIRFDKCSQL